MVCGDFLKGYELPPRAISKQSADYSNRTFVRWLVGRIDKYMPDAKLEDAFRLSLMDVGTGAADGSIRFELDRPYATGLKSIVAQYEECKKKLDADLTIPMGYGDLYALGGKVIANREWRKQFAGIEPRFDQKNTFTGLGNGPFGGDIDDPDFVAIFTKLYAVASLTSTGSPVLLGRKDATEACSEADAARIPLGSDDAEEYKKWFQSLGIKFLAIVPLAKYVDTDGACVAAIRANDQLNGFWERNEKDSAFPGLEEKRQMYAFTDSMASRAGQTGKLDNTKYGVAAFVKNLGWSAVPPIKDVDINALNPMTAGKFEGELYCHVPGPDGI